ncbi:uncharacterized protein LOC132316489 [Cornus florida]|uniref:uncharacterized protein LOC132316489 n=1 Tax=Cornus florida TaxID=4283 RepID=UPI0028A1929A|nr:uncharacterized protein LOC132316489 [Cornus florida]
MQVFSSIIDSTIASNPFKFHWRCKELGLTHLIFVDDVMLFCHGSPPSVQSLLLATNIFANVSGLRVNHNKSTVFLTGVPPNVESEILDLVGFEKGCLPIRYLGVPLISTMLKAHDCKALTDKITSRITHWTSPELKKHGAKVAWHYICLPSRAGGLGIPSLHSWNRIAILKHLWNIIQAKEGMLWINWVNTYLLKGRSIWEVGIPNQCSWTWRKLLQLRPAIRPLVKFEIGNGINTKFWYDRWSSLGPLHLKLPPHQHIPHSFDGRTTVSKFITGSTWSFPRAITTLIPQLTQHSSLPNPNPALPDRKLWIPSPNESHNHLFFQCSFHSPIWTFIQARCGFHVRPSCWNELVAWASHHWKKNASDYRSSISRLAFAAFVYNVWCERNRRIFQRKRISSNSLLSRIIESVRLKLMADPPMDSPVNRSILTNWDIPWSILRPPPRPPDWSPSMVELHLLLTAVYRNGDGNFIMIEPLFVALWASCRTMVVYPCTPILGFC